MRPKNKGGKMRRLDSMTPEELRAEAKKFKSDHDEADRRWKEGMIYQLEEWLKGCPILNFTPVRVDTEIGPDGKIRLILSE
jgi:hypothetical protein